MLYRYAIFDSNIFESDESEINLWSGKNAHTKQQLLRDFVCTAKTNRLLGDKTSEVPTTIMTDCV